MASPSLCDCQRFLNFSSTQETESENETESRKRTNLSRDIASFGKQRHFREIWLVNRHIPGKLERQGSSRCVPPGLQESIVMELIYIVHHDPDNNSTSLKTFVNVQWIKLMINKELITAAEMNRRRPGIHSAYQSGWLTIIYVFKQLRCQGLGSPRVKKENAASFHFGS